MIPVMRLPTKLAAFSRVSIASAPKLITCFPVFVAKFSAVSKIVNNTYCQ